jgi:PiT family inorganic phosphate transporter
MTFLIIVIALALIFDYINGFHDAANSIATIVSTKVLTPFQAVLWAAVFNFVAYFIFKDHGVARTISKLAKPEYVTMAVVFSALIAAIAWNLLTWWFGIPSSSSHTLIGGFAGAAVAHAGLVSINPEPVLKTVGFIFLAPLLGMLMAFIISVWFINSFRKGPAPKLISIGIILGILYFLSQILVLDNAKLVSHYETYPIRVIFDPANFKWVLLCFIIFVMATFTFFLSSLNTMQSHKWFKRLQLVSSAAFSIGHGGNDAQKVMGIIFAALVAHGTLRENSAMPFWIPLACYSAIALGTLSGGWKIIKTMGTRITKVTPFEGVAAETGGAITLFITEFLKIPVSSTHTIAGSIIGVGATKRLSAVRWGITVNLLWAWILTIPVSALLAAFIYFLTSFFVT